MRFLPALVLMLGLSACATDEKAPSAEPTKQPTSTPSAPGTPNGSGPLAAQPDASDTKACAEVRAGIDAFNARDYAGSIDRFRLAVPLARAQAQTTPSQGADDLVEAVKYYAGLAPDKYLESAASPEFLKYQVITLGQCMPVGEPSEEGSSGPPQVDA